MSGKLLSTFTALAVPLLLVGGLVPCAMAAQSATPTPPGDSGGFGAMGGLFGFGERDSSLFGYAQTLSAGIRHRGRRPGTWELKGGYAFDRFYFIGQDFSDRDANRLDVDPGAFVAVSFRLGS